MRLKDEKSEYRSGATFYVCTLVRPIEMQACERNCNQSIGAYAGKANKCGHPFLKTDFGPIPPSLTQGKLLQHHLIKG
jgi:hypothetical protein